MRHCALILIISAFLPGIAEADFERVAILDCCSTWDTGCPFNGLPGDGGVLVNGLGGVYLEIGQAHVRVQLYGEKDGMRSHTWSDGMWMSGEAVNKEKPAFEGEMPNDPSSCWDDMVEAWTRQLNIEAIIEARSGMARAELDDPALGQNDDQGWLSLSEREKRDRIQTGIREICGDGIDEFNYFKSRLVAETNVSWVYLVPLPSLETINNLNEYILREGRRGRTGFLIGCRSTFGGRKTVAVSSLFEAEVYPENIKDKSVLLRGIESNVIAAIGNAIYILDDDGDMIERYPVPVKDCGVGGHSPREEASQMISGPSYEVKDNWLYVAGESLRTPHQLEVLRIKLDELKRP